MSPLTHLLASWIIATKATDKPRDVRLITLAGVLPDADGLGLVVDLVKDPSLQMGAYYYPLYHHWLAHGIVGGLVISVFLACFGSQRWRVFLFCLLAFHIHLLGDLLGSRGPSPQDLWSVFYLGPLTRHPEWIWLYQWRLDGWQNRIIELSLFFWALWLAAKHGRSFVGVFNSRLDNIFVKVLQKWRAEATPHWTRVQRWLGSITIRKFW